MFLSYMRRASAGYIASNSGPCSPRYQKWSNVTCGPRDISKSSNFVRSDAHPGQLARNTLARRFRSCATNTDDCIVSPSSDSPHAITVAKHASLFVGIARVRPLVDQYPHLSVSTVGFHLALNPPDRGWPINRWYKILASRNEVKPLSVNPSCLAAGPIAADRTRIAMLEFEIANILKGRGRAFPPVPYDLYRTLMSDCGGSAHNFTRPNSVTRRT